ncbi:MAG: hypothetical protein JSR78_13055 [Proteobacteria bacterium]|nr:hypothetical protein [Pseudomonadota bacterium]
MKWPIIIVSLIVVAGGVWYLRSLDLSTTDAAKFSPSKADHPSPAKAAPEPYPISATPPPADATVPTNTP